MANLIHRFRLRFVWLLTRHPRFRPLYHADVAAFDPIGQAEFLASAGYYVAAAMLCRMAIEQRMKCLALLSPRWHELNRKQPGNYGYFLLSQGLIGSNVKQKYELFYSKSSKVCHGDFVDPQRCRDVLRQAHELYRSLAGHSQQYLAAKGGSLCQQG